MTKWRRTPKKRRYAARRLDPESGEWLACEYADLVPGDIFRAYATDGAPINPVTEDELENDGDVVALVHQFPIRGYEGNEGFAVEVTVGTLIEVLRLVSQ